MSYVDAGYAAALATLFVYAISLILRRRRWERALAVAATEEDPAAVGATDLSNEPGAPGGPP
jgi:hypothetical protein